MGNMKEPTYTPRKAKQPDHPWLAIFQVPKRTKEEATDVFYAKGFLIAPMLQMPQNPVL